MENGVGVQISADVKEISDHMALGWQKALAYY